MLVCQLHIVTLIHRFYLTVTLFSLPLTLTSIRTVTSSLITHTVVFTFSTRGVAFIAVEVINTYWIKKKLSLLLLLWRVMSNKQWSIDIDDIEEIALISIRWYRYDKTQMHTGICTKQYKICVDIASMSFHHCEITWLWILHFAYCNVETFHNWVSVRYFVIVDINDIVSKSIRRCRQLKLLRHF